MSPGEIVELGPDQVAVHIDDLARAFVAHKEQSITALLDELRVLTAGREALKRSTYSDHCVARLLDHVEQLHATIRQLAELSAVDGFWFALNQSEITRTVHKQLATFAPPKA
jgi:hypothetical protein